MRESCACFNESLRPGRFYNDPPEIIWLSENKNLKGGGGSAILLNLIKEVILT